jgi:hypothetical protein
MSIPILCRAGSPARLNASKSADNVARPENVAAGGEIASPDYRRISLPSFCRFNFTVLSGNACRSFSAIPHFSVVGQFEFKSEISSSMVHA